jgi:hypothetical protein
MEKKIIEYDIIKWANEFLEKNVKTLANMIKEKEEIEKIFKEETEKFEGIRTV